MHMYTHTQIYTHMYAHTQIYIHMYLLQGTKLPGSIENFLKTPRTLSNLTDGDPPEKSRAPSPPRYVHVYMYAPVYVYVYVWMYGINTIILSLSNLTEGDTQETSKVPFLPPGMYVCVLVHERVCECVAWIPHHQTQSLTDLTEGDTRQF